MMENDLLELKKKAKEQFPNNKKTLNRLKQSKPRNLDDAFHAVHEEVFGETDCLKCANCCKTTSPIFYHQDIERVSRQLRMKVPVFIETYLNVDEDGDYVLKSSPCPFLDGENYCLVYQNRPTACREYPHTNRKRMYQIMDLTLKNTEVCPAVFKIVERIQKMFPG
jgi:uncharacterized protein